MIAKGTPHNDGAKLANYLITGKGHERAELFQLRGFASDDIRKAFRSVHVMADGTRAEQPFFHVQVRTPEGETLTNEQWERVADRIESKLGFKDQPRAIAFHTNEKTGHRHMHVAWSRIDDETMTARPLPFYKLRLKEACRELEHEIGLTRVSSERSGPVMAPSRAEFEQARRLGIDIHQVRATIRECWERSDNGASFRTALSEQDLVLCQGDRRSYVVVDRAGGLHALGKRILGHTVAEVRSRLSNVENLPTVEQARVQLGCPVRSRALDELTRITAIENRDVAAMLESITRQRATFTARDLDWAVGNEIANDAERKQFVGEIIAHPSIVQLSPDHGKSSARYTTRDVLESEGRVLRAAEDLVKSDRHVIDDRARADILGTAKYDGISREQVRAIRHATKAEGLTLIDGQAGTGKSYTMTAIREIYESRGFTVVGLAPTNAVAQDMNQSGFGRARTIHSELYAIEGRRRQWDDRTAVIVDEAAMIDTRNMVRLTEHARNAGAKLVLIGDDRQLSSVERGGMFSVLKERHGAAELTEVRRQQAQEDRVASSLMAKGSFREALATYAEKGAIRWSGSQSEAADALVEQWARDTASDPSKSRFIFAYTNREVGELNSAIRQVRAGRGELGPSTSFDTKHGRADFAAGDRIQFTGTDKQRGIYNGHAGTITHIEGDKVSVSLDGGRKRMIKFDGQEFQDFRHGYAGTIYRGQGRTIDQTYLFHSEYWRAAASYVALTRHREKAELFVSRDTASDINDLACQLARIDDRRAASHFPTSTLDRAADDLLKQSSWKRYLTDPAFRRTEAAREMEGAAVIREQYGGGRER